MNIVDMAASPDFNPETNKGRGDWSLYDVSTEQVFLDRTWRKPSCIEHGAMNCVSADRTIWRCVNCGRSCFDVDRYHPA